MGRLNTREFILDETYRLLFVHNWEAITIEQIESSIGKTRGAIFYFFKNKKVLFNTIISERFLCKFETSEISDIALRSSSFKDFFNYYRTPFERAGLDMTENHGQTEPNPAVLNIVVQARKLYPDFDAILDAYIRNEIQYIADHALVLKGNPKLIGLFKTYFQLTCGALLFQSSFVAIDIKKQLQSYVSGLALLFD